QLVELLEEFRSLRVFPEDPKRVPPCSRGVLHIPLLDEDCTPYAAKQRRFFPEETQMIQAEVKQLQECGIIRPSTSAWAAAVVAVRKKYGTLRLCTDFMMLNDRSRSDSGGLGNITSIFDTLKGSSYFTAMDLALGFFQLEIAELDKHKTAFRDAHGQIWEYNRYGFGLKILLAVFSSYMREALGDLKGEGVENWPDDLFCYSSSFDEHMNNLRRLLTRLKQYGLSVNFPKSSWCMPLQEFLGNKVDRDGLSPAPSIMIAVAKLDPPSTVEQLRSFLGMTGYMR
ncbi:unnamed protein product, partial [Choristocarpus tenellus]